MKTPVTYHPGFVDAPAEALVTLQCSLQWERRESTPRSEYYCNDIQRPYVYGVGKGRRLYEPKPYHPVILVIRKKLEEMTGHVFEVCFLNRYLNQSDALGWHADDSPEMDDARPIATVSLGVKREIWFRKTPEKPIGGSVSDPEPIEKLALEHGSMCLMSPGMQDTHQHRIPKASFFCGERISLTFRGYVLQP